MEENFWHNKWEKKEIGFHEKNPNQNLIHHFSKLSPKQNDRIFVPLCGKTLDIHWLLKNGFRVVGAELNQTAVKELFEELNLVPEIKKIDSLEIYSSKNIDIFLGNIFHLKKELLGKVDFIYDRAALVALPIDLRKNYTKHILEISENSPQLLICYEYDQSKIDGPPFSISDEELKSHYDKNYSLELISKNELESGMKGKTKATENIWILR